MVVENIVNLYIFDLTWAITCVLSCGFQISETLQSDIFWMTLIRIWRIISPNNWSETLLLIKIKKDIIITKYDKGNEVVAKLNDVLSQSNTYC